MVKSWILVLFTCFQFASTAFGQNIWAEVNSNVTFCCNMSFGESEALMLNVNDKRISSLYLKPNSEVGRFTTKSARNWIVDQTREDDICVTKAADNGLGEILERKDIIMKFYEQAKIIGFPKSFKAREGSSQLIECKATGFPDLYVTWSSKDGKILNQSQSVTSSSRDKNNNNGSVRTVVTLPLELSNIHPNQHGEVYACEATTGQHIGNGGKKAIEKVTLEVFLYPRINMSNNVIYTDLGVEEKFTILVTGYPTPTLKCNDLPLGEPTMISDEPQGGTWLYPVVLDKITPQHLREYMCTANNSLGSVNHKLEITVAPAPPRILSSNSTEFADYYLLNWETKSRAPLKNVTISIHELPKNTDAGGSIVARSPKHHELVFNLEEDKVDRTSTSIDGNTTNNHLKSNIKKIWHHLTNLSADTQHDIALSVCNVHACTKSSSLSSSSSSSSVGSHLDGGDSSISGTSGKFVFKTPQFDGRNKVDPILLQRNPKDTSAVKAPGPRNYGNFRQLVPRSLITLYAIIFIGFSYWI
uniref:Ig-like domain-containing protein n=1 Tax=Trichobilharzia regenti TaxID=157069 RepID=A0AA85J8C1_TRIRE|nr:unnamed protein product [Trichobilharzia regenti]